MTALFTGFLVVLSLVGIHRLVLTLIHLAARDREAPTVATDRFPVVTVQLPVFNERFVARRLLGSVLALEYPRESLQIQVLDDSTDDTREILAGEVQAALRSGFDIQHIHRCDREGFKAGALEAGRLRARGELFLVLDADFTPRPDFLMRMVAYLTGPRVGAVQARWEHVNRESSLLTRLQALLLDAHFQIEHHARFVTGSFFNFNGTAGLLSARMLEDVGGWQADTLTEDLDLSYRAQIAGYTFVYASRELCPGELPERVPEFKSQQFRWVKGSIQTARKLLPRLLGAPLPVFTRLEAALHLLTNVLYPLLALTLVLMVPASLGPAVDLPPGLDLILFLGGFLSLGIFYGVAHLESGRSPAEALVLVPLSLAVAAGLALSNTHAVFEGLLGRPGEFVRTPKVPAGTGRVPAGYRASGGWLSLADLILGSYLLVGGILGIARPLSPVAPFLLLSGASLLISSLSSVGGVQSLPDTSANPEEPIPEDARILE